MTTNEALNKIAFDEGYTDWSDLIGQCDNHLSYITQAMITYAQQFIDVANEIIGPACDVLDENYDEEYDKWHTIQEINELKN